MRTYFSPIALGELINKEYESETEKRKQQAVEQAVNESWRTAQELREQAVKDAVSSIQSKHEKQLRRLSRQNDRAIKVEKCLYQVLINTFSFLLIKEIFPIGRSCKGRKTSSE